MISLGYIGKETAKQTIVSRLRYALDWMRAGAKDKQTRAELFIATVSILAQSPSKYSLDRMRRRSLEEFVELAICDVDCAPYDYQCPWQLEQFTQGEKISLARKQGQHKCVECKGRFRAARKRTYCSNTCKRRAQNRRARRKSTQPTTG